MRILILFIFFFNAINSQEIIIDKKGDYYLMKSNGSYKKLPKPSPGKKYIIKKKIRKISNKNIIFKKVEKKSRTKGNQGIK